MKESAKLKRGELGLERLCVFCGEYWPEERSIAKRDNTLPVEVKQPERKQFYRYTDWYSVSEMGVVKAYIEETVYYGVRQTPCGWWVSQDHEYDDQRYKDQEAKFEHWNPLYPKRWVSSSARKRLCYPTRREALHSFIWRKARQIGILRNQLKAAEMAHKEALNLYDKNEVPTRKRFPWT
jgi:hypothetical protein